MQDIHVYDGKLKNIFSNTYPDSSKKKLFDDFIDEMNHTMFQRKIFSVQAVIMITNDLIVQRGPNFDPLIGVDASDILADILIRKNYKESLEYFQEQLADIQQLGHCSQGRVTRLLSYWLALPDRPICPQ